MEGELYPLETTAIFGIRAGRGAPAVFLHGITANAYVFAPILARLQGELLVVSIDQRGHGRSGRPGRYAGEDFAADVAALVRHLGAGPALLVGHSLGARNALVAAERHPAEVRGVVAVDFTPFIEAQVFDELEARVQGGDRRFDGRDEVEAYLAARYPLLPPDAIRRRAEHGYRAEPGGGLRPLADPRAMALTAQGLRASLEDTLRRIRQPTLLVRGAQSRLVSPAAWQKTRALRPDLEATEIAGADHYVPEEAPDAIAALVRRAARG